MIEFIVISLFVILVVGYYTLGRNLSRPTILYVGGFLACAVVAYNYKLEWGLYKMSAGTAFFIVGGALLFYLIERMDIKKHNAHPPQVDISSSLIRPVSTKVLLFFFLFQIFAFSIYARAKMSYAMTTDLAEALVLINNEVKFEETLFRLPFYIAYPYTICMDAGFIWAVLLPYYQYKPNEYKKQKWFLALNFVTCIVGTMLSGGRMLIVNYLGAYLSFLYICYQFKTGWKGGFFSKKTMLLLILGSIVFSLTFQQLGYAVGRKESDNTVSIILAMYCGAQTKNLDDYLKHPSKQSKDAGFPGQFTFNNIYNGLAPKLGLSRQEDFSADLPFNDYGIYPLGNVYSCYYNYYADFGYYGILLVLLMSFAFSFLYRKTMTSAFWATGCIDVWILFYSAFIAMAFLSFFSNQFFAALSLIGTIKRLIFWWVLSRLLGIMKISK